jgi:hypothetical protein
MMLWLAALLWCQAAMICMVEARLAKVLLHNGEFVEDFYTRLREHFEVAQHRAHHALLKNDSKGNPFSDVQVAFPLDGSMFMKVKEKTVVGPDYITHRGKEFVMYAAGIDNDASFEEYMSQKGITVHAFDCTIPADTKLKYKVTFHHWCLGESKAKTDFENNTYSQQAANKTFVFHTLAETKRLLGHEHIDILKMDIEGFEWELLTSEILSQNFNSTDLPEQIVLELHTEGANPKWVPQHLSSGKTRSWVNAIVLQLWHLGYRVTDKVVNTGDPSCADFNFLRVYRANNKEK